MNERTTQRNKLGLTQQEAATKAGVSLATWRRWEEHPEAVSEKTRRACGAALVGTPGPQSADDNSAANFVSAWGDSGVMTPRQACALSMTLGWWADSNLREWLKEPSSESLYDVGPFAYLDRRVMFHIGENRAFALAVQDRCEKIAGEIEHGVVPFGRPGAFIDELLMGAALLAAPDFLNDMPELFEQIPERQPEDRNEFYEFGDHDWDGVSDAFDDMCQWDEWEVPLSSDHPLLPAVLAARHPFTWLDRVPATGAGYLQGLMGLLVETDAPHDDRQD